MLGGMGDDGLGAAAAEGMATALAARYHLASCLRCYVEAAQPWQVGGAGACCHSCLQSVHACTCMACPPCSVDFTLPSADRCS